MRNGLILQKLQALEEVLLELRSLGRVDEAQLNEDWRTRRAVERDLQILVEVVVDICQRLLSLTGQTPATTGAVERCIQMEALSRRGAYRQMVQFRNFIVRRYERVETAILAEMVNCHLRDFERFRTEILAYVRD